jgi:hypothetical protein
MSSATVITNKESDYYFEKGEYISPSPYFLDNPIPRSVSPECLETIPTSLDEKSCPPLSQRSRGSNDTISSSNSSVNTPTIPGTPVPPEIKLPKPIPVKKNHGKKLSGIFNGGLFGLTMTPAKDGSLSTSTDGSIEGTSPARSTGRRVSGTSIHSSSSVSSTASKISKSFSRVFGSSGRKNSMSGHYSPNSTSGQHVPILSDKYGDYVKPEQRSTKGMGSTSKKNIASGATAVIRLVRQRQGGRILAVKEFKKRGKTEAERDYQKRMLNEYCISKTASNHKHIVETLDLVKDEKNRWCVVMEYVCFLFCLIYLRLSIFTIFILTNIYIYILILVLGR